MRQPSFQVGTLPAGLHEGGSDESRSTYDVFGFTFHDFGFDAVLRSTSNKGADHLDGHNHWGGD